MNTTITVTPDLTELNKKSFNAGLAYGLHQVQSGLNNFFVYNSMGVWRNYQFGLLHDSRSDEARYIGSNGTIIPYIYYPNNQTQTTYVTSDTGGKFILDVWYTHRVYRDPAHISITFTDDSVSLHDVYVGSTYDNPPVYRERFDFSFNSGDSSVYNPPFSGHDLNYDLKVFVQKKLYEDYRTEGYVLVTATLGTTETRRKCYLENVVEKDDCYEGHIYLRGFMRESLTMLQIYAYVPYLYNTPGTFGIEGSNSPVVYDSHGDRNLYDAYKGDN